MISHYIGILLYLSLALASVTPQKPFSTEAQKSSLLSPRLHSRIDKLRAKWGAKGITIGLAAAPNSTLPGFDSNDWVLETLGFGEADKYGNKVDGDTLFAIASNSKVFNALSVALLIHNNTVLPSGEKLEWSTKIKDVLPEWKLQDQYMSDHVDLLDLGSMRSGMPRHDYAHGFLPPSEIVAKMRYLKPSTELRRNLQYNNNHYVALGLLVERVSGLTLPEYVQKHIYDPIGMSTATYNSTQAAKSGHRSDGFMNSVPNLGICKQNLEDSLERMDEKCLGIHGNLNWWTDGDGLEEAGPGGILLSANDMKKWIKELLHPTVLPSSVVKMVTTGHTVYDGQPRFPQYGIQTYGIGQIMYTYRGYEIESHTGSVPGQMSTHVRVPQLGFGFMIVVNQDNFGTFLHSVIQNEILDEVLQVNKEDLVDWEKIIGLKMVESLGNEDRVTKPEHPKYPKGIDIEKLEGHYADKAYGDLNLVKIELPKTESHGDDSADLMSKVSQKMNITGPIYLAEVNKVFNTHIIFTHFDDNLFNWTNVYQKDNYNSKNEVDGKITTVQQIGTAVFTEDGVGMFGGYWGAGSAVKPAEIDQNDIKGSCEVWYCKLKT
ncbi:uncharacterized protein I206_106817 [Kwoniella pini CBS 10737]|uniref:Beta-lactamase-related domain-containing protein n=1 Tax=Kwoniella pini CBS 10737 TaxID=1296096 RepID=A0A1B9HZZ8_9TREE|nr:uncharacterized protein I206_05637 [Kwoniella pini CBS 10737]OCF48856.1 hypothetical protein I206_05637 [Kwoniella pini CBS 10737]